jgi:hypothetical protein
MITNERIQSGAPMCIKLKASEIMKRNNSPSHSNLNPNPEVWKRK